MKMVGMPALRPAIHAGNFSFDRLVSSHRAADQPLLHGLAVVDARVVHDQVDLPCCILSTSGRRKSIKVSAPVEGLPRSSANSKRRSHSMACNTARIPVSCHSRRTDAARACGDALAATVNGVGRTSVDGHRAQCLRPRSSGLLISPVDDDPPANVTRMHGHLLDAPPWRPQGS